MAARKLWSPSGRLGYAARPMASSLRQRLAVGIVAVGLAACDAPAPPQAETAAESEPKALPAQVRAALDPAQLAAAQAMAGRLDAAAGSFDKLMRRLKPADLDQYCRDWTEFEYEADFAHFQQGVRIAEQAFRDRSQSDGEPVNSTAGS